MFPTTGPPNGIYAACAPARPNQYINRRSYRHSALPRGLLPPRYTALRRLTSTPFHKETKPKGPAPLPPKPSCLMPLQAVEQLCNKTALNLQPEHPPTSFGTVPVPANLQLYPLSGKRHPLALQLNFRKTSIREKEKKSRGKIKNIFSSGK